MTHRPEEIDPAIVTGLKQHNLLEGRIVLGKECAALRDVVQDLMAKGKRKIIFNLGMVDYIDSSGLGNLISVFARVRKQGGELKLLKLTNKILMPVYTG